MIHQELWHREVKALRRSEGPRYTEQLSRIHTDRLFKLLERTDRHYEGQTMEDWLREKEEIYQILVQRGAIEEDPPEDVKINRQKWRDWYHRKIKEDPEYHQMYVQRVQEYRKKMPEKAKKKRHQWEVQRQKERYHTDEEYAQKRKDRAKRRYLEHKRKMETDPAYAEEYRRKDREKQKRHQEKQK